jgi:outer membrane protein OmpA-like peptidoglycan-associated protein
MLFSNVFTQDIAGSKDHKFFTRLQGFYITQYEFEEFGSEIFYDSADIEIKLEGVKTFIRYESETESAPLKIIRNFSTAIQKIGGKAYEMYGNETHLYYKKDGYEMRAIVHASSQLYTLTIVEKEDVKLEVTATGLYKELLEKGKAIVYINFDFASSTIKPESKPEIDEIIKLLIENPSLKLSIEGHTDNIGDETDNHALSEKRTKSVVAAIIAGGIDAARLQSKGFGETKPIAENNSEEGRAKNRRVELIKL